MISTLLQVFLPEGLRDVSLLAYHQAELLFLRWFYADWPEPHPTKYNHLSAHERNAKIVRRSRLGESTAALARDFGVSDRRMRRIIQRYS
jgi:hypothetical protein